MAGISTRASTTAQPIRCVKDTWPPRVRARCVLMIARFSMRTLAGTARAEVAVGTDRDSSMFLAVRAAAPRRRVRTPGSTGSPSSWAWYCPVRWA